MPDVGLNIYKHYISNLPRSLRTHHWELRNHWIRQNFTLDRISPWSYRKLQVVCAQSCPTLCDPLNCSLPGSSIRGILQARIMEWVAISFSRGSSWPRDSTCISCSTCIGNKILYHWATCPNIYKHYVSNLPRSLKGTAILLVPYFISWLYTCILWRNCPSSHSQ